MFLLLLHGHNEREREILLALLHTLHSPRFLSPTLPRYIVHRPTLPHSTLHYHTLSCIPYVPLGSSTQHYPVISYTAKPCPTLPYTTIHSPAYPTFPSAPEPNTTPVISYTTAPCPSLLALLHTRHWAGYSAQHCPALPLATLPRSSDAFLTRPVPVCCRPPQLATSQPSSGKRTGSLQTCWRIRTSRPTSSAVCGPSATFSSPPRPMGLSSDPGFPPWSP